MYDHDEHDEAESGICDACGCGCSAKAIDMGIGSYEFWGARGVHRDIHMLSPCCEAEVVPGGEKVVESKIVTAKKEHLSGKIKPGQKYRRTVSHHWRENGPGWFTVKKIPA